MSLIAFLIVTFAKVKAEWIVAETVFDFISGHWSLLLGAAGLVVFVLALIGLSPARDAALAISALAVAIAGIDLGRPRTSPPVKPS